MKLHQVAVGSNSKRVRKASQTGGPDVQFDEPEPGIAAAESRPGELRREMRQDVAVEPQWTKRGLFKKGFHIGAPRVGGIKLRTK